MTNPPPHRVRRGQAAERAVGQSTLADLAALPGVPEAVEAVRTALTALRGHPALRRGRERVAAAAAVRAARASAALDGAPLVLDRGGADVGDMGVGGVGGVGVGGVGVGGVGVGGVGVGGVGVGGMGVGDMVGGETEVRGAIAVADPRLAGALRVAASLPELTTVWQRAPLQALARLHVLAAADLAAPELLGRPRPDPGIAPRLAALADVVSSAPWPAPVMVAVVHGELLALRAFGSADGVVARAAARLALMTSGLDPDGLGVPEVAFLRSGPRYPAAAREFDSAGPGGVRAWIVLVGDALIAGASEGGSIADAAL